MEIEQGFVCGNCESDVDTCSVCNEPIKADEPFYCAGGKTHTHIHCLNTKIV